MKGLILSGGKGTRLRPITHTAAKQLVPVANKPILFYAIEALREAGIKEIGIIVGDTHQEVRDAVGDGSRFGARVTYIQQEAPLGLAHAVKIAEDFMAGESFLMYLGDNLIRDGVGTFVRTFNQERPDAMILLAHVHNPQQFGIAELENGRIVRLIEKPQDPPSDLAIVGVYLFTRAVFESVRELKPSARGELEITDAIQGMIDRGKTVLPHLVTGWWKDTGKLEDMLEANRIMLDALPGIDARDLPELFKGSQIQGRVTVGRNCRVVNSVIRGPAILGDDCQIYDAYVGPYTSIGPGVVLRNTEIEHSIILAGSAILDLEERIADSLIGKSVTILRSTEFPHVHRFMLGDHSGVVIP